MASGWAPPLTAAGPVRRRAPQVRAAGGDAELARDEAARSARLPGLALRTARPGWPAGPVLFQVPRRGYLPGLACDLPGPGRCAQCGGPLSLPGAGAAPRCAWCGQADAGRRCPRCGQAGLRALVIGAGRTAEELGRAFPGSRCGPRAAPNHPRGAGAPAVVVATPGAEPRAAGGYAAALLLDGWALLGRPSLRAAEEALRRWLNAAALVRPAPRRQGGGRRGRGAARRCRRWCAGTR